MDPLVTIFAGGTILFLLVYAFAPRIARWALWALGFGSGRAMRRHPSQGAPGGGAPATPGPARQPSRGRIQLRDAMAVLFSVVFGLWALYVLTAHPDSIVHGPKYDSATKQAATGVIGAISGLWIGRAAE